MSDNSFDPVYATEEIALNLPLLLVIGGILTAAVTSVIVAVLRKVKGKTP